MLTPERLLRFAVAFSLLFPAIHAWFDPYAWIGYFPPLILTAVGSFDIILLHVFGALEIILALWILFGKNIFLPSVATAVILLAIVALNPIQFFILFRDISIVFAAIALAMLQRENIARPTEV